MRYFYIHISFDRSKTYSDNKAIARVLRECNKNIQNKRRMTACKMDRLYTEIYYPTHALRATTYITYITPTCFDVEMPSSGNYYNKVVQNNLPIYVLFILINIIKMVDC